jgi:hypothetical protein
MVALEDLYRCFQGVTPAFITTCAKDGTPNVTYLSQVYRVDANHVALSCQFFNKTRRNVEENPYACVHLYDPVTLDTYELELRFDHAETSGPLFDTMSARIQAIASHTGMEGIFRLLSADVYEVLSLRCLPELLSDSPSSADEDAADAAVPSLRTELRVLSTVTERLRNAPDLDALFSALLGALDEALGFAHAMVLLPDEAGEKLYTVASRGYGEGGIGAEVQLGQGLIGTAAERRTTLRVSGVEGELRYGRAIRQSMHSIGGTSRVLPEIPLPGLPDAQSHMAIPLVCHERLFGVLAVESRNPLGFDEWHEAFLDIVGNQVATAMENVMLRAEAEEPAPPARPVPPRESTQAVAKRVRSFHFYRNDDCVFVDGEYLVRNVPGRILWKILRSYAESGRTDFTNRELRLDPSLGLPPVRDNLESRLILLRKRLEQKCPDLKMVPKCRGQFRLELHCDVQLRET